MQRCPFAVHGTTGMFLAFSSSAPFVPQEGRAWGRSGTDSSSIKRSTPCAKIRCVILNRSPLLSQHVTDPLDEINNSLPNGAIISLLSTNTAGFRSRALPRETNGRNKV